LLKAPCEGGVTLIENHWSTTLKMHREMDPMEIHVEFYSEETTGEVHEVVDKRNNFNKRITQISNNKGVKYIQTLEYHMPFKTFWGHLGGSVG